MERRVVREKCQKGEGKQGVLEGWGREQGVVEGWGREQGVLKGRGRQQGVVEGRTSWSMRNLQSMSSLSILLAFSRRGRESIPITIGGEPPLARSATSSMSSAVGDQLWMRSTSRKEAEKKA